jgi:hypothetical protein
MPPFVAFLLGALVGALGSAFAPQFQRYARPLLKEAIRSGLVFAREAQVQAVEFMETIEDVYAEAKAEAEAELSAGTATMPARGGGRKRAPAVARKTPAGDEVRPAAKRAAKRAVKSPAKSSAAEAA